MKTRTGLAVHSSDKELETQARMSRPQLHLSPSLCIRERTVVATREPVVELGSGVWLHGHVARSDLSCQVPVPKSYDR